AASTSPAPQPTTPAGGRCGGCATSRPRRASSTTASPRVISSRPSAPVTCLRSRMPWWRVKEALVPETPPPAGLERDYPLARLTTIRAGGAADLFGRPAGEEALVSMLEWAHREGIEVGVVGSGSNLLISDHGFRGLVLKLDGELGSIERDGERILCGAG